MSIEAMKRALEAMEYADACLKKQLTTKTKHEYAQDLLMSAGTSLRQAIAEAEKQEPFGYFKYAMHFDAWVQNRDSNEGVAFYTHPQPKTEQEPDVIMHLHDGTWDIINSPPTGVDDVNLYYAQPKREPLTDEQIEKIIKANMSLQMNLAGIRQDFEAAHGIKDEA